MSVVILNSDFSALDNKILAKVKCTTCSKVWYLYLDKLRDIERVICDCEKDSVVENCCSERVTKVDNTYKDSKRISKIYERIVKKYGADMVVWRDSKEFKEWALGNGYRDWKVIEIRNKKDKLNESNCRWVASKYGVDSGKCDSDSQLLRIAGGSIKEANDIVYRALGKCSDNAEIVNILNEIKDKCNDALKQLEGF